MDENYSISVLSDKIVVDKIYRLIRIKIKKCSASTRSKYLYKIMEENNAFGLIELYPKEGIVRKPKQDFLAILIL